MARFKYKTIDAEGETREGTRSAADKFELARILKESGETLVSVTEITGKRFQKFERMLSFLSNVSQGELIVFARNMGSMLEAGLTVGRSLSVLERQVRNKAFKKVIGGISKYISEGKTLAGAMEEYPKVFSALFISMVRAGEESGNLSESLGVLATQLDRAHTLKKKVRGAMMYPSIIFIVMLIIGGLMFTFIVPTLVATFEDMEVDLPLSTLIVIWISQVIEHYPLQLIFGFIAVVLGFFFAIRTESGKHVWHTVILFIPGVRTIVRETNAANTSRTLASLMHAGVEIVHAIGITRDVVQNVHFKEVLTEAETVIQKGTPMSEVFEKDEKLYPVLVAEMIKVGEETGQMSQMLENLAKYYEEEVDRRTKDMSTIIEPVLMVIIGAAVGFFAYSMLTPIYTLIGNFS